MQSLQFPILFLSCFPLLAAGSSQLLLNQAGQNRAYSGIGQIALSSTCTAFFIQTPGNGPAYALSAGHCYSLHAQEVYLDLAPSANTRSVLFNYFSDTRAEQVSVPIRRIAYSTMKGWDLLVLELGATRADLAARIVPVELEPSDPSIGEPIFVAGIPASFFEQGDRYLRRASCTAGERVDLLEFTWHFYNMRRHDCEDIVGGISGSPAIAERTGRAVGIVNTTTHLAWNTGGDFDCYAGRPCEIGSGGQRVEEETNYFVPVAGLIRCFAPTGEFSPATEGCPLDRGRPSLTVTRRQRNQQPGATWAATVTTTAETYRYKSVAAGAGDCRDAAGYSQPVRMAERNTIDDALPREENRYLLCVVPEGVPVRDATVLIARIDATPPVLPPFYSVMDNAANYRIAFEFIPPELSSYSYKFGAPDATQCDDTGYRPYLRIPVSLSMREGPYRFCFYAQDEADNRSQPFSLTLGGGASLLPQGIGHAAGFRPAVFAPGQWISMYGLELGDYTPMLGDRALFIGYRSATQINARIPQDAAAGEARIGTERVMIGPLSPGILFASYVSGGQILAYTSGLAAARPADLRAEIGRTALRVESIEAFPETGIELVRLRLPEGHNLQGRQFVRILAATHASNRAAITLP